MKRVITDDSVTTEHGAGRRRIDAPAADTVVTPAAWTRARELGVEIVRDAKPSSKAQAQALLGSSPSPSSSTKAPSPTKRSKHAAQGTASREVDASGVIVVRGGSVQLGAFAAAGAGRDVGLFDVVTGADRSPMSAGFMAFGRSDSFPWTLTYDEIDLVLEGTLHVEIDGRTVVARAGDVVSIPKGSKIVFATPSRVRLFYVTWPADWSSSSSSSPPRPPKS